MFLVFSAHSILAQNQAKKWYFGNGAALDFMTITPTSLAGNATTLTVQEGTASMSDVNGNLLFYTDGMTIWNQFNLVMPNGSGIQGSASSTQSSIILKQPGNPNLYYVFTQGQVPWGNPYPGLRYSVIDMSLASGTGSVIIKNVLLRDSSVEKIAAIRHCNGTGYWVMSHDWGTSKFRAYLLTAAGVNTVPVISTAGVIHDVSNPQTGVGQLKISPSGRKLGLSIYQIPSLGGVGMFQIFDFDPSNGMVSNAITTGTAFAAYGCEFSSDGSKFYGSSVVSGIMQWDLCAGTPTAIVASKYNIPSTNTYWGLQLATNGKIYAPNSNSTSLSVINNPDLPGSLCSYSPSAQSISNGTCTIGTPAFLANYLKPVLPPFTFLTNSVSCLNTTFTMPPLNMACAAAANTLNSVLWNFGDPNSPATNTSTLLTPSHNYPVSGT